MTRLPAPPKDGKIRVVPGFKLELTSLGVTMRPLRSRKPDAEVFIPWDAAYTRALMARAAAAPRKRRVTRSLLRGR